MPRGDRTGPMGMGARTGRGLGYCAGYDEPGCMHPGPGFVEGRGMGYGRGWGADFGRRRRHHTRRFWGRGPMMCWAPWESAASMPRVDAEAEMDLLKSQADWLQEQMDTIRARMDEISKPSGEGV